MLRTPVGDIASERFSIGVRRALDRVYGRPRKPVPPVDLTAQHLRDTFIIQTYRRQARPVEVPVGADLEATHDAVVAAAVAFIRSQQRHSRPRRPVADPSAA